ncbi:CoA transferase [Streptomyces roseolilacinus]|uniref:CoA transferase n=1 Tax=Streptomyces roseolilacinus TaxID=66904 RepID=A0A918B7C2_9ACTN|nr:CoA transferase [Streptomyces roseolilacinus]GGQ24545.1 CoA transferase [Streptomyces roseolilacinus]
MNRATFQAWAALGADQGLLERVSYTRVPGVLPARLPVPEAARAAVSVCALAAAELAAARSGGPVPRVRVDDGAVATAFHSERFTRLDGRAGDGFAPLSRFWRTADGWVRTHANYPHHRDRLWAALGLPAGARVEAVAEALAGRRAAEVEDAVYEAGGLAVAVRDAATWAAGEQGALVARRPLVALERQAGAPAPVRRPAGAASPCAGTRVLDLTRVLAGPVATRTLALLGADVLRVDAPGLPESPGTHQDTGLGKRSTLLDLGRGADRRVLDELLAAADVVVTGYRPGALDRFGLAPEALAERRPGLVVARLSAWGAYGPWGGRRGFDSLVQAATGIALLEGDGEAPGALPAQALDHGTGYLVAAAVLRALTERRRQGGTWRVEASLAQTAHWLLHGTDHEPPAGEPAGPPYEAGPWLRERDTALGRLRHALSPVSYEGGPADWARPPGRWGADAPRWTA